MRSSVRSGVVGATLALAILAAACGSGDGTGEAIDGPTITIGAQDFGESAILAEIYSQALADGGYTTEVQSLAGFRDLEIEAFDADEINFAPEYAASMLEFLNDFAGEASGDAAETTELLQARLDGIGLQALEVSDAIDTNAFVVTPETSEEFGITSLSELAENGADLTLGGPPDCETNPFCIPGLQEVYGVDLSGNFTPLDAGQVTVQALESGEIDIAILFSTSGIIADKGWLLLEDDQSMLAADNVVPVVTTEVAEAYGQEFADLVNAVSAELTTADLTEMNRKFDIEQQDPGDIATEWLTEKGLIES